MHMAAQNGHAASIDALGETRCNARLPSFPLRNILRSACY